MEQIFIIWFKNQRKKMKIAGESAKFPLCHILCSHKSVFCNRTDDRVFLFSTYRRHVTFILLPTQTVFKKQTKKEKNAVCGNHSCYFVRLFFYDRPPLWSSGQSFWLQIQRSRVRSRLYQIFWVVVGLERGPLSLVRSIEEILEQKSSGLRSRKQRLTAVGIRCADHVTPSIRKIWH